MGYHRAGFDVVGVDIAPQPHYPFEFIKFDALDFLYCAPLVLTVDAIHASPPCQAFTSASNRWRGTGGKADSHPELIDDVRSALRATGLPWVIENVVGASRSMTGCVITLDGGMFGLGVHRPRLFESNMLLMRPPNGGHGDQKIGVYGRHHDGRILNYDTGQRCAASLDEGSAAMGIDWMDWRELCEAIPPAYTRFIGEQLLEHIGAPA